MFIESNNPKELAKEMFWLAWQACGGTSGLGFLQNAPSASKEDVWNNISNEGDYPGSCRSRANRPYADYVFGRMMKFGIDIEEDGIEVRDVELRGDYQSWCYKYPTVGSLVEAAQENLNADYMEALVDSKGLDVVLEDLREVVEDLARRHNTQRLWWIEQDLYTCVGDAIEWGKEV